MKKITITCGCFVWLIFVHSAFAQIEDFITGTTVDFLAQRDGRLFWKADCSQVAFSLSRIQQRPVDGDRSSSVYSPATCSGTTHLLTGLGLDGVHVYWVNGLGVRRISTFGGGLSTIATNAGQGFLSINGPVTVGTGHVYWTEELGEFRDRSIIYRVVKTGGNHEVVHNYEGESVAYVRSMEAMGNDRLIFLLGDGRLVNSRLRLLGEPPFQFYAWVRSTVSVDARAMFLTPERLFWADRSSDGRTIYFRSAPLDDLTAVTLHHFHFRSAAHDVLRFVADPSNLFYQDMTTAEAGPLMRKSLTSGAVAVEIAHLPYRVTHMTLTERHVIWRKNNTTLSRLPINAAAATRDLSATGLEVIQVIQNSNNQNPLVAGKQTFVRFFGQIVSSSMGETNMTFWPSAYLHGEKDGVPLDGSPLAPYQSPPLISGFSFRTRIDHGFAFRLPDSWTRQGSITLRGVVNPNRIVSETSYANNTRTVTANFVHKAPICMVMKPTRTRQGIIYNYSPGMQPTFDYIEALLPTSRLRVVWGGGVIEEPYDPFHVVGDGGPFEVSNADDDGSMMLTELNTRKVFTSTRYCEGEGGFDHYVALLKQHSDMPWWGLARLGDYNLGIVAAPSAFFNIFTRNSLGVPFAATTQCQELAHNYGRGHVNCGDPDTVDSGYPYDTDKLYSPGMDYIGFDPFRRQLVLPDAAADYMSYCGPKWTSDYTWKALFNRISTASRGDSSVVELAGADDFIAESYFLQGVFDAERGTAAFKEALLLSGPVELAAAESTINGLIPDARYELRAYAGEEPKSTFPVFLQSFAADEGARHGAAVTAIAKIEEGTTRLDFVDKQNGFAVLGSRLGGGAAPTVAIMAPEGGSNHLRSNPLLVKWSASDPDNDVLVFTVRFSHDDGLNWQVIASGTPATQMSFNTSGIPGSDTCRIEVIASDGIFNGSAVSEQFSLERGQPKPFIFVETARGKDCTQLAQVFVRAGEEVVLHGKAFDDEDGEVDDDWLFWTVTGPVTRSGTGPQFTLTDLPPGDYNVRFNATDTDKDVGMVEMTLTVDPHHVEAAGSPIVVDGFGDDPGYLSDPQPLLLRYNTGSPAQIRMVQHGGRLHVCASGLRTGTDPDSWVGISVDGNNSGGSGAAINDFRFDVFADGRVRTMTGNGTVFVQDSVPNGLVANVSAGGGFWTAELEIDLARLGGWNGQRIGLAVGHYRIDLTGEINRFWPVNASANSPATWGGVVLGADPNDPTDSDGDGLPDKWELAMFGDLKQSGLDDPDKDGLNNYEEWISGTHPLDAESRFRMTLVESPEGVRLSWPAVFGRTYTVYRSDDLLNWEPAGLRLAIGEWLVDGELETAFYRVEVCHGR